MYVFLTTLRLSASLVNESWSREVLTRKKNLLSKQQFPSTEYKNSFHLPWWLRRQSVCLQCGRPRFSPWVGKISWRRKWLPTPVSLPGEARGWRSLAGGAWRGVTKSWTRLSNSTDEGERGERKSCLKLNTQKTKIMASGPITSWQINGETVETVTDFIFSGSKITADGDCSHEVKKCLLLGRKGMTKLDNTLKSRDITLPTKVCMVKAMVFPVVMYGCESWTTKKAER